MKNAFGTLAAIKTIAEQVLDLQAKGSKLTVEELTAFLEAKEAKKAKAEKKTAKKWAKREANEKTANSTPNLYDEMSMHEINLMNAKNNLPSSMR